MNIIGDPSEWYASLVCVQDIIRDILMPIAWQQCDSECAGADLHENVVTDRLVKHLIAVKCKKRSLFDHTKFEIFPQVGRNPDTTQPGRSDILVSPCLGEEEINLIYECKWLNKRKDCASAYVGNDGIGRFLTGKYARRVKIGNMIGYVYKSSVEDGAKNILNEMIKQSMTPAKPTEKAPLNTYIMTSQHERYNNIGLIEITHILLHYS